MNFDVLVVEAAAVGVKRRKVMDGGDEKRNGVVRRSDTVLMLF